MNEIASQLAAERDATVARITALSAAFDDIVASIDGVGNDDEHDPEGATIGFERAQVLALLDAARTQLQSIDDAVERVNAGGYGRCVGCGEPIGRERLEALPTTSTCVGCARPPSRRLR